MRYTPAPRSSSSIFPIFVGYIQFLSAAKAKQLVDICTRGVAHEERDSIWD
jgi:hypothetical protein